MESYGESKPGKTGLSPPFVMPAPASPFGLLRLSWSASVS